MNPAGTGPGGFFGNRGSCFVFSNGLYFYPYVLHTIQKCILCPGHPLETFNPSWSGGGPECNLPNLDYQLYYDPSNPMAPTTNVWGGSEALNGNIMFAISFVDGHSQAATNTGYLIQKNLHCTAKEFRPFQQTCDSFTHPASICKEPPVSPQQPYYTCTNSVGSCISQAIAEAAGQVALVTIGLMFIILTFCSGFLGIPTKMGLFQTVRKYVHGFASGEVNDDDSEDGPLDNDEALIELEKKITHLSGTVKTMNEKLNAAISSQPHFPSRRELGFPSTKPKASSFF